MSYLRRKKVRCVEGRSAGVRACVAPIGRNGEQFLPSHSGRSADGGPAGSSSDNPKRVPRDGVRGRRAGSIPDRGGDGGQGTLRLFGPGGCARYPRSPGRFLTTGGAVEGESP